MNAPSPTPHIDYGDRAEVLAEIGQLGWALRIHAEVLERAAELGSPR